MCVLIATLTAAAQSQFEKKPISNIKITFASGAQADTQSVEEYRLIAREAVGDVYSTTKIRDAIEALYNTKRLDAVTVNAAQTAAGSVDLNFEIRRKVQAQKVNVEIGTLNGDKITEDDLLFKLNIVTPGSVITDQSL